MNVPKLRFKEFNGEWERVSFGKFFDFLQTNSFSREIASSTTGTIRNIHYGDILTKLPSIIDLNEIELPFLDSSIEMKNEVLNKSIIKDGDIVIADTAEDYAAGMTCEVIGTKEKAVLSGLHTMLCRKKGDNLIALGYLGYYMNTPSYHNQLLPLIVGSKVYSINKNEIKKTVLSMPEFVEQEKIVDLLRTVDKKINSLKKSIDLLNKQKKGFMQKIFSQELRFKDEDGKEFPDWEEKKLGEIFEIKAGGDIDKNHVSKTKEGNFIYPIYANALINEGIYGYSDIYKIDNDSITVTGRGDIGVAKARFGKFYPIVRLLVLIPKETEDMVFFENLINYTKKYDESTGVPQLTVPQLSKIKVKVPSFEEQFKIGELFRSLDAKMEKGKMILKHWQQIKKGLLQQMFV